MPLPVDKRAWVLAALEEFELRLLRYALRLLGDEAAARDAVQHAFLRLCGEAAGSHEGKLAAWLFAVVRNRAVDLLRERGRMASLEESEVRTRGEEFEEDPAMHVERRDLHELVRRIVDTLPTPQAEAVVLWSDGFSYSEMSSITGRGEGNLRVLVHRAITALKEHPSIKAATNGEAHKHKTGPLVRGQETRS